MVALLFKTLFKTTTFMIVVATIVLGIAYLADFKTADVSIQESINKYLQIEKEKLDEIEPYETLPAPLNSEDIKTPGC